MWHIFRIPRVARLAVFFILLFAFCVLFAIIFLVMNMAKTNCESCVNYYYDDELEEYCCDINLDEDEMVRFLTSSDYQCPYYRLYDEYGIVKKQN